jgi:PAS domain S-box-containing protein
MATRKGTTGAPARPVRAEPSRPAARRSASRSATSRLLQTAVEEASRLLDADGAIIYLVAPADGVLRFAHDAGIANLSSRRWVRRLELRMGQGMFGVATAERRVVLTRDYPADDSFVHAEATDRFVREAGLRSMVVAPLAAGERLFGAMGAFSRRPDAFSDAQVALVRSLADHAAAAMANALLIEELAQSRRELERKAEAEQALREIAARITAIREPSELLQHVVDEANRLVRADGTILDLLDPATNRLSWGYDSGLRGLFSPDEIADLWLDVGVGATGIAVAEDRVITAGDHLAAQFPPSAASELFFSRTGFRSMIAAPIAGESGRFGVLEVYSRRPDAFDDSDAALIGSLADQAAIAIHNARLIDELARSSQEIQHRADAEATLREIAAGISAIRDSDEILQQTVDETRRLLDSRDARIDLLEDGRLYWRYTSSNRSENPLRMDEDTGFDRSAGIAGIVVSEGRPYRTVDYLTDERFVHTAESDAFVRQAGIRSVIAVPLIGEGGPLGVISVATDRPDAYDNDQMTLLAAVADQAAIAIQNARLIEALERSQVALAKRAETERSLREMASRIAELREPDELLRRIVDDSRRLLGSDGAHLTRMSDDGTVLVPVVVAGGLGADDEAWLKQQRFPVNAGINGLAAGRGEPICTIDYTADDRIPLEPGDLDTAARLGLRGMAAAPLRSPEGHVIGTLAVSYRAPHDFDADQIAILKALADHAAIAVTNTTLYDRLRQSQARYRHLVQNSPDIIWSIGPDARFTFISATVERMTGWTPLELLGEHFGAIVHDSTREVAEVDWTAGLSAANAELRGRLNLVHRDGRAIPAEFIGMASLDADGRFAGANGSVRDMTEREDLERDLRRQAAELAAGEERSHLARELHDSVTQALFSMTLVTRTIEMQLDRDVAAAREQLTTLRDLQREALAEMRALIFELRPGNLEQDGLIHALKTHSSALQARLGLPIVVKGTELADRLPIEIEEVLYRIAQEALHNIVKHAAAQQVNLELSLDGSDVRLAIVDDGVGFNPSAVGDGRLGLTGMRARAVRVGATLAVQSRAGHGTTIEVVVPPAAVVAARARAAARSAEQRETVPAAAD